MSKEEIARNAPIADEPIQFVPIYQKRAWGGRKLESWFHRQLPDDAPYGESWELVDRPEAQSVVAKGEFAGLTLGDLWNHRRRDIFGPDACGERFPLLFKILDAEKNLSIQVHPPAEIAEELGGESKSEIWYVAHAEEGAELYVGLKKGVTREIFEQSIANGTTAELVHVLTPKTGDFIFIESGRLHSIGEGLLIFEIQQNSDTTYRVFDWNRLGLDGKPRDLHVANSLRSINFDDHEPTMDQSDGDTIAACEHFRIDRLEIPQDKPLQVGKDGEFCVITVVQGSVRCGSDVFEPGRFFLIPATAARTLQLEAASDGTACVLRATA